MGAMEGIRELTQPQRWSVPRDHHHHWVGEVSFLREGLG